MPLTDTAIRAAKPQAKAVKLFGGQENRLTFGVYPDVPLKTARDKRDAARRQLAAGIDPSQARRAERRHRRTRATSRPSPASHAKSSHTWVSSHRETILQRLDANVFPWIGKRLCGDIKAQDLLAVLRRIEERGALETAHRSMQNLRSGLPVRGRER